MDQNIRMVLHHIGLFFLFTFMYFLLFLFVTLVLDFFIVIPTTEDYYHMFDVCLWLSIIVGFISAVYDAMKQKKLND
mgnify:CR=1 FL=1